MGYIDRVANVINGIISDPVGSINYAHANAGQIIPYARARTVENAKYVYARTAQYMNFVRHEYISNLKELIQYVKPIEHNDVDGILTGSVKGLTNYNRSVIREAAIKDVLKAVLIAALVTTVVTGLWWMVAGYIVAMVMGNLALPISVVASHAYLRFQKAHPTIDSTIKGV